MSFQHDNDAEPLYKRLRNPIACNRFEAPIVPVSIENGRKHALHRAHSALPALLARWVPWLYM